MDIYREITDRIITQMEQGTIPWTKPWIARGQAISYAYRQALFATESNAAGPPR